MGSVDSFLLHKEYQIRVLAQQTKQNAYNMCALLARIWAQYEFRDATTFPHPQTGCSGYAIVTDISPKKKTKKKNNTKVHK